MKSLLTLTLLVASAAAQKTDVTTNAFGSGRIGPAIMVIDETGKVGYASLGPNITLVKSASGALSLEVSVPLTTFKVRQISSRVLTAGNTFTLPSEPRSGESVLVVKNGATMTFNVDYQVNGVTVTFLNTPIINDLVTIAYIEKLP